MIINFKDITPIVVDNMRGGEGNVKLVKFSVKYAANRADDVVKFSDEVNSVVRITIKQNCSIGLHTHENDQEIIYVIKGNGKCLEDGVEYDLYPGLANYCAKGKNHSIRNPYEEDLELFAVITKQ